MSISFPDVDISIGGLQYSNLVFVIRLLTYDEVLRLLRFNTKSGLSDALIEEDVFDLVFDKILGIDEPIDIDDIEAGIVSTISGVVQAESLKHIYSTEALVSQYENELSGLDSIQAIVSRYFNTPYDEVRSYPVNKLLKRFALFKSTFPAEAALISGEKENGE
jgi:hypothetical protein